MRDAITRLWWLLAVRGAASVVFGVIALTWPLGTLAALVLLLGIYAIFDGVVALLGGLSRYEEGWPWWPFAVEGVLGIGLGAVVLAWPDRSALVLWWAIAGWALATGFIEAAAALTLRRYGERALPLYGAAACSVLFGVLMIGWPRVAALVLAWLIGLYAILFGLMLVSLALSLRRAVGGAGGPSWVQ